MSTFQLAPRETPPAIRKAGASNDTGQAVSMSTGDWVCRTWIESGAGQQLSAPRTVTETAPVDGVDHFVVELRLDEADLLTTPAGETTLYRWQIEVESASEPYRDRTTTLLEIAESHGELSTGTAAAAPAGTASASLTASNPTALPSVVPTLADFDGLALVGAQWVDQQLAPGRSAVPESQWPYAWLNTQVDATRNAINALLAWARAQTSSGGSSSTPISDAYAAWVAGQPDGAATEVDDWLATFVGSGSLIDLTASATNAQVTITPSGGGSAARISAATSTAAGAMTAADRQVHIRTLIPVDTSYADWRAAQADGADTAFAAYIADTAGTGGVDTSTFITRQQLADNNGDLVIAGGNF